MHGKKVAAVEKDIRIIFGNRLKTFRRSQNISQEELAFRSGLHRTYISSVERGERNISLANIAKLAKALDIEPYKLLRGRD
jgi:transcriptional regulator with XRE-family HTH domain